MRLPASSIVGAALRQLNPASTQQFRSELRFHLLAIVTIAILWLIFQWHSRARPRVTNARAGGQRAKGVLAQLRDLFVLLALIVALMHAAVPQWMKWSEFYIVETFRWLAVVPTFVGLGLFAWAADVHRRGWRTAGAGTPQGETLVVTGPYARIRHPMYLGVAIAVCSISVVAANWVLLLMSATLTLVLVAIVVPREDARLASRFDSRYAAYAASTPRFVPRAGR